MCYAEKNTEIEKDMTCKLLRQGMDIYKEWGEEAVNLWFSSLSYADRELFIAQVEEAAKEH